MEKSFHLPKWKYNKSSIVLTKHKGRQAIWTITASQSFTKSKNMTQYKRKHPIKDQARNYLLSDYVNTIIDETGIDIRVYSRKKISRIYRKYFASMHAGI